MPSPVVGAIGSSVIGAGSARSAARSQERAAADQTALQERIYDETVQRFEPYSAAGLDYQNALRYELLGGELPTFGARTPEIAEETYMTQARNQVGVHDRTLDPIYEHPSVEATRYRVGDQTFDTRDAAQGYAGANTVGGASYTPWELSSAQQFNINQANDAIEGSAAASGGLFSGATMRALQNNAQMMGNNYRDNYLNRLTAGAAGGQAAAANQANAGANYAAGASNALANRGNAQAAGAIGVGNALNAGIGNVMGIWNYQNQNPNNNGTSFWGNWGSS